MTPVRTFLALPLPKSLRKYMAQFPAQFIEQQDKINWVKPENIHITLNFMAETDPDVVEDQAAVLNDVIENHYAFDLGTTDTGVFPHANDPRVLWIGAAPYDDKMTLLINDLRNKLQELGYRLDNRKFQPHITLGRVKSISRKSNFIHNFLSADVRDTKFVIDEIKWYESTLTATGAIYKELKTFKLKTGGQ